LSTRLILLSYVVAHSIADSLLEQGLPTPSVLAQK